MTKALVGSLFVLMLVVALVIAVLHSTSIGAAVCGSAFLFFAAAVLFGKM